MSLGPKEFVELVTLLTLLVTISNSTKCGSLLLYRSNVVFEY
jgi:hypothetical protein